MPQNQWDQYAEIYDEGVGAGGDALHINCIDPIIQKYIGNTSQKNVVDLGCGNGYLFHKLSAGTKYIGVDSANALLAKANGRTKNLSARFVHADITKSVPLDAGIADVVISNMVLQYLPDLSLLRKNVLKLLKSNGIFVVIIDHPAHALFSRAQELIGKPDSKFIDPNSYFVEGQRTKRSLWDKAILTYYHRTVSTYINTFAQSFRLDQMDEVSEDNETPRILGLKWTKI